MYAISTEARIATPDNVQRHGERYGDGWCKSGQRAANLLTDHRSACLHPAASALAVDNPVIVSITGLMIYALSLTVDVAFDRTTGSGGVAAANETLTADLLPPSATRIGSGAA
jgi:hypothetical protein